jgi:hypothetical protein
MTNRSPETATETGPKAEEIRLSPHPQQGQLLVGVPHANIPRTKQHRQTEFKFCPIESRLNETV